MDGEYVGNGGDDVFSSVAWDTPAPPSSPPPQFSEIPPDPHSEVPSTTITTNGHHHESNHDTLASPSSDGMDRGFAEYSSSPPTNGIGVTRSGSGTVGSVRNKGHQRAESLAAKLGKEDGDLVVEVREPVKELDGTKDAFVSYLVISQTTFMHYQSKNPSTRRRYQDFVFLRENLAKDFPACVVPPLPDKHRMEYLTGDRFSPEFLERRRQDLQQFLSRIARHPTLSRAKLVQGFLESTEWNVLMHKHALQDPDRRVASTSSAIGLGESPEKPTILDNFSDTLLNAFTKPPLSPSLPRRVRLVPALPPSLASSGSRTVLMKQVRKPDERFVEIREGLEKFQECVSGVERWSGRGKGRMLDLSTDYDDYAAGIQVLGYLESGITDPLTRFENGLLEFSNNLRDTSNTTIDPLNHELASLLSYSSSFNSVLKLRDQKQLDFEELSAYLSQVSSERDRLAGGYGYGMGLGSYLKERWDGLRGQSEWDGGRESKMNKLDSKIDELSEAVTTAQDTLEAFNDEVLSEHVIFQLEKRGELKKILSEFADGQIEMYKKSMEDWDKVIPHLSGPQSD